MKYIPVIVILLFSKLSAQPLFQRLDTVKVYNFGNQLKNPWAGGFNFTEWSAVDIDLDGHKDLAVFDKSGEIIRIFKNDGIPGVSSYSHAAQFQSQMPTPISSWAFFQDYNNDTRQDLFTYTLGGGMCVYKNISTPGNVQFTLLTRATISNFLGGSGLTGTPVNAVAIPAVADIDNDGDLDALTFQSGGTKLEFHKNISIEQYGHLDSLRFDVVDYCWGDATENNCEATLNESTCPLMRLYNQAKKKETNTTNNTMHSGSCLLCLDIDGDNDEDLLLGDISCDSVEFFRNAGSLTNAHFDYTTKLFPNATNPISFKQFPCSYFLDVDNDGARDLIAAPNIVASENYKSVWFYKNNGPDNAPNFQFVKKTFLQEQMLDFGEGAFPTTLDYDSDGDMDLLVGNFGYYIPVSTYSTKLALLENTGTASNPKFNLVNPDYAGLSSLNLRNLAPATGDLDGDGDMDLIVGDANGRMTYYKNTAPIGSPANFVFESDFSTGILAGMDVGLNAYPQIFDVNNDGLKDLLVGEYEGWLNYYENRGTVTVPQFNPVVSHFGNVHTVVPGYFEGQSAPCMVRENGVTRVLVGSERGYIYRFGNIDGNLAGNFSLMDTIYCGIREGENVAPHLFDFDNDGLKDMVLGNYSGGLAYFKGTPNVIGIEENQAVYSDMVLFPNPANDVLNIKFNSFNNTDKTIRVYNAIGRQLLQVSTDEASYSLKLDNLQAGFYILETVSNIPNGKTYKSNKTFIKQ
ncbi:MAG: repeat protein [Bacteroidetes bacterium]|jgi:hypothetical protein|nr:repeat protein [Bacteroidota bacterium]